MHAYVDCLCVQNVARMTFVHSVSVCKYRQTNIFNPNKIPSYVLSAFLQHRYGSLNYAMCVVDYAHLNPLLQNNP